MTPSLLKKLRRSFPIDPRDQRLIDAVNKHGLRNVALNQKVLRQHDPHFTHRIRTGKVTNQRRSGRCWMFAAFNVVRPYLLQKMRAKSFKFSEAYLAFWDKLERSNRFLEWIMERSDLAVRDQRFQRVLKNATPDGGWWNYFVTLVRKYGAVPRSVMPETVSSAKTRTVNKMLRGRLLAGAVRLRKLAQARWPQKRLRQAKAAILRDIYRMLVYHYGPPPQRFAYRFKIRPPKKKKGAKKTKNDAQKAKKCPSSAHKKQATSRPHPTSRPASPSATRKRPAPTSRPASAKANPKDPLPAKKRWAKQHLSPRQHYTPQQFARALILPALEKFVTLTHLPSRPYHRMYRYQSSRNLYDQPDMTFLNLPLKEFKAATLRSVLAADPVWFAADVGQQVAYKLGLMHPRLFLYRHVYGIKARMTKAERLRYGYIHPNHAMVFAGVDLHQQKPVKWLVENSWGAKYGKKGYLHMYDGWFDQYVLMALVHKRHLPPRLQKMLSLPPTPIPEEDNLGRLFR